MKTKARRKSRRRKSRKGGASFFGSLAPFSLFSLDRYIYEDEDTIEEIQAPMASAAPSGAAASEPNEPIETTMPNSYPETERVEMPPFRDSIITRTPQHSREEWAQLSENLEELGHNHVKPVAESFFYFLSLPSSGRRRLFHRLEGFKKEYKETGAVPSTDSYTLLALLKYMSEEGGRLEYLPKAAITCWKACFIHLPKLYPRIYAGTGRSMVLFKTILHYFYYESVDIDRGIQSVLNEHPFVVNNLTIYRGVTRRNAAILDTLVSGETTVFKMPMSCTLKQEVAEKFARFTNPYGKILIFRFGRDRAIHPQYNPYHTDQLVPGMMISGSFKKRIPGVEEKCEYELLLLGGLRCLFVERTENNGYECFVFDVISRYSFLDPQSFYNCVRRIDETSLAELTTPYRMERPSPEQSHEFMSLHFPPGEALRHLIDHVSSIRQGIDFGPSEVLPRLVRLRTRLSVTYENNGEDSSKSRENGKAYKRRS